MPGLRIHHPTITSAVILVPIPAKTQLGSPKNVQLVLDDNGDTIVSEGVWGELQLAMSIGNDHQFIILNEVPDPPALLMGGDPDHGRDTYIVEQEALRQIAPAGVRTTIVPRGLIPDIRSN